VTDVVEPSDGPPELPSDYRAFRRSYRWLLLYGPWALAVLGVALIGVGLFADRPGEVALAAIGFGAAMFIAGVLLPRMRGPVELGPGGVKGAVEGLPQALMLLEVAREAAEQAIPADEPDRDRRVNEVVGQTMADFVVHELEGIDVRVVEVKQPSRPAVSVAMRRRIEEARKREEAAKESDPPPDRDS
jgi:hypothetical protein